MLQGSFDPIIDIPTGEDLIVAMARARALGDWDFSGMFTAILSQAVREWPLMLSEQSAVAASL